MEKRTYNPKIYSDKEIMNVCGIYQIRNLKNNKIYIGSAKDLKHRKYEHFRDLKSNTHHNKYLMYSFKLHGKENFIFEVIEFCSIEEKYKIEQYWIDKFYGRENCYNINPIANKPSNINKKGIYCIELNREFESIEEASRVLGLKPPNISFSLKSVYKTCGGYHFLYQKDMYKYSDEDIKIILKQKSKKFKPIICLDDNKIFYNSEDICKEYNIKYFDTIIKCCKNKQKTVNKHHFMFLKDFKNATQKEIDIKISYIDNKRKIYCSTTDEIFNSIQEACIKYNLYSSNIVECCKGKITNTKGYKFRYIS